MTSATHTCCHSPLARCVTKPQRGGRRKTLAPGVSPSPPVREVLSYRFRTPNVHL
ncbi:hypothetical protein chiPu_0027679, partial [Chiloscyllium punctatum]|nr:hypothetical protein [Chiloscyllium punctatum]